MQQFTPKDNFNCGDTWPVGSFKMVDVDIVIDELLRSFDVPCWPEMTGLGEAEELIGFWVSLFLAWERVRTPAIIEENLLERPGLASLLRRHGQNPLPILKGQMIGPSTLIWALKKAEYPVVDRTQVLRFVRQAFEVQGYLLAKAGYSVIISLDEPCAFLDSTATMLWQELFSQFDIENHFGVALHCCGEPQSRWLELPWDVVHVDFECLVPAYNRSPDPWRLALQNYFASGAYLALGVVDGSSLGSKRNTAEGLESIEEIFSGIGFESILLSTSCGLDARTEKGVRDKLSELSFVSQEFLKNRKSN